MNTPTPAPEGDDRRVDPCVWLAPVGLLCLIVAAISAAATGNIGPTAVVCALAALPCLGFGVGAIFGEARRGGPWAVVAVMLTGLGAAAVIWSDRQAAERYCRTHHCHHRYCHCR